MSCFTPQRTWRLKLRPRLPTTPISKVQMGFFFSKPHEVPISSSSDSPPYHYEQLPKRTQQQPRQPYRTPNFVPSSSYNASSSSSSQVDPILGKPYFPIYVLYTIERELGRGQSGITYLCTEKATGLKYACKSISKRKLTYKKKIEDVKREIMILQHLKEQPNIVEFKGAYEDSQSVHLVMELCSGGELFDRIITKGSYSEREAVSIFRQIMNVVHACHFMGVMHRDLKPENFLLVSRDDNAPLKATDFGLSVFIEEGKVYRDIVGSTYYMAPEVLKRSYGKEIDVWSAGVILYVLLSGVPPFSAETEKGVFDAILEGKLDLHSAPWPYISAGAKDLIRKMLTCDPKKRIAASDALEHPWMKEGGEDSNQDCPDWDPSFSESEIRQLMDAADVDKNGTIDYCEFMTATMHRHRLEKEDNLYKDNNSGFITRDELRLTLTKYGMRDDATIYKVINEVDIDNDGRINYEEFAAMLRNGTLDNDEKEKPR